MVKTEEKEEKALEPAPLSFTPPPSEPVTVTETKEVKAEEKPKKSTQRFQRLFDKMFNAWEKDYRVEKAKNLEYLHNDLAEIIANHINSNHTDIEVVLTTLDFLKHELISEKLKQLEKGVPIEKVIK